MTPTPVTAHGIPDALPTIPAPLPRPPLFTRDFPAHWCATGKPWCDRVQFDGSRVIRDATVLYSHQLGHYPVGGPGPDVSALKEHTEKVKSDVWKRIHPDDTGYAVIDYEAWLPTHATTSSAITKNYPVAADFDRQAERFLRETLNACRTAQNRVRWGFYGLPYDWRSDVYTRPEPNVYREGNDSIRWLWDAVDYVSPCLYLPPDLTDHGAWIKSTMVEAVRVARGKPVIPFVWHLFLGGSHPLAHTPVPAGVMTRALGAMRRYGADGVFIWDGLNVSDPAKAARDCNRLQNYWSEVW